MTTSAKPIRSMTYAEFLEFEASSPTKHEFVDGEVFAMTGGMKVNDLISGEIYIHLRQRLAKGGPCRVHQSDVAVRVDAANGHFYPDLHVTCDPRDHLDPRLTRHPSVIVEVLSESTRGYDSGDKLSQYMLLDSLVDYVLVDTRRHTVTHVRRRSSRQWDTQNLFTGDTLVLEGVGLSIPVEAIYDGTDVPAFRGWPRLVSEA